MHLRALFEDNCDAYRLKIMRDMRLHLAIPLEDDIGAHVKAAKEGNKLPLRVFKPLKFSFEGR